MAKPINPDINPFGDKPTRAHPNINPSGPTTGTEGWGLHPDEPNLDQEHLNPKEARPKKRVRKSVAPRRSRKRA
ncbi:MAG TPA: hypothetical protein VKT29_10255 [Terriglobales bacterium]|nr:hypothetical protein [Terriglobales bacterium]